MPTYDYICTACHNAWELEQRIVEDPVKKCPKCGKNTARRQISSGAGFILKGGGWYADGYGSKKTSGSDSKTDEKAPKAESKSEKAAEKKTETPSADSKKESAPSGGGSSDTKKAGDTKSSAS
jgi:putative FmdB family regulatory protein